MSHSQAVTLTHHAMLVAWGQFAQCIDLTAKIEAVPLHQKAVDHTPNRKVLEFFVVVLGGLAYLKDISLSAHPLDSDAVQLGYQAAKVSFHSPTYGRQWLSSAPHPGSTVACTEAEAMVCAAKAKTGIRPRRRTDLLAQRLAQAEAERQRWEAKTTRAEQAWMQAQTALQETWQQLKDWQDKVAQYEVEYKKRQRPERPHSRLAKARAKVGVYQRRQARREKQMAKAREIKDSHMIFGWGECVI
jgi:hypothetical protein